jgi:trehalose-phosphatase
VRRWKSALEKELSRIPGLWIEDKGLSLAVHYRDSSAKPATRRRILKAAEGLAHARVFGGKQVVNIAVDGDPNKGTALVAERETRGCDWVLYVGDDINDEDAFAIGGNLVSVRVGRTRQSYAAYYLRSQREIDTLLDRLVALRQAACLLKPGSEAGRAEREPRSAGRRFPLRRGDHAHPGNCCE